MELTCVVHSIDYCKGVHGKQLTTERNVVCFFEMILHRFRAPHLKVISRRSVYIAGAYHGDQST